MEKERPRHEAIRYDLLKMLEGKMHDSIEYIEARMKLDAKYIKGDSEKYNLITLSLAAGTSIAGKNIFDFIDWQNDEIRTRRLNNKMHHDLDFNRFERWNKETDPSGINLLTEMIEENLSEAGEKYNSTLEKYPYYDDNSEMTGDAWRTGAYLFFNEYKRLAELNKTNP